MHGVWTPRLVVRLLVVASAVVVMAEPSVWHSLASAQQTQQPSLAVTKLLRAEPASRVRLPIQVGPAGAPAKNSFIRIRGLPPAAALSDGHAIAAGTWAVPLVALPTLTIILPAGMQGESIVGVSLVTVDGNVLAEATMTLAISPPAPATQQAGPPARAGMVVMPLSPAARERALGLHAKGLEQLERGNVNAARRFFELATEIGLPQSAVALAGTYDPDELAKMKVIALQPNIEEARKWYEKARELGAAEAVERLRRLGAR
jgi:hypothetical protein